jgi:hypothetical protein
LDSTTSTKNPESKQVGISNCCVSTTTEENIHTACSIVGKTAAGLGIGIATGISLVVIAAAAEVAVPALLVLKAFGLTGGAFGFLKGIKKD